MKNTHANYSGCYYSKKVKSKKKYTCSKVEGENEYHAICGFF